MIMVGSVCREVAVAVVVTAASGYDLGYVWRSCGKTRERTAGGYYLNASLQGEAPGRWFGRGVRALGLAGEVQRRAYDDVYAQHDPVTGARLGRAPGRYVTFEQHDTIKLGRLQSDLKPGVRRYMDGIIFQPLASEMTRRHHVAGAVVMPPLEQSGSRVAGCGEQVRQTRKRLLVEQGFVDFFGADTGHRGLHRERAELTDDRLQ